LRGLFDKIEPQGPQHAHALRKPCSKCGSHDGVIRPRGFQDCVFCTGCDAFQYNAPRVETGRAQRSVQTVHSAIKPKLRALVLMRAKARCEVCGASGCELQVGHLVSVVDGLAAGLSDDDINSKENLAAMCAECNSGLGTRTVPLLLAVVMIQVRNRMDGGEEG
jgi:hypothetical protein